MSSLLGRGQIPAGRGGRHRAARGCTLAGESPHQALALGWVHGVPRTTTPVATTMVTLEQVTAFAAGGSARSRR